MNKNELLSTYTAEQLAGMVINLQSASEVKNDEIHKLKWQISSLEEENGRLQAKLDTYNEYLLPRCTKEARELIDGNHFIGVMIVSCGEWNNRGKAEGEKVLLPKEYENYIREILNIDASEIKDDCHRFNIESLQRYLKMESPKKQSEIDHLKSEVSKCHKALADAKKERDKRSFSYQSEIDELSGKLKIQTAATKYAEEYVESLKKDLGRSQTTINQIDEIIEELFGVTHDVEKPGAFKEILREKVCDKISEFLPPEPIKIADMLISATYTRQKSTLEKTFSKAVFGNNSDTLTENVYSKSELRQIAEHLLVYCGHNVEGRNETE